MALLSGAERRGTLPGWVPLRERQQRSWSSVEELREMAVGIARARHERRSVPPVRQAGDLRRGRRGGRRRASRAAHHPGPDDRALRARRWPTTSAPATPSRSRAAPPPSTAPRSRPASALATRCSAPDHASPASANCVLYMGARPRFVDIDPATWNLDCAAAVDAVGDRTEGDHPGQLRRASGGPDAAGAGPRPGGGDRGRGTCAWRPPRRGLVGRSGRRRHDRLLAPPGEGHDHRGGRHGHDRGR